MNGYLCFCGYQSSIIHAFMNIHLNILWFPWISIHWLAVDSRSRVECDPMTCVALGAFWAGWLRKCRLMVRNGLSVHVFPVNVTNRIADHLRKQKGERMLFCLSRPIAAAGCKQSRAEEKLSVFVVCCRSEVVGGVAVLVDRAGRAGGRPAWRGRCCRR